MRGNPQILNHSNEKKKTRERNETHDWRIVGTKAIKQISKFQLYKIRSKKLQHTHDSKHTAKQNHRKRQITIFGEISEQV